MEKLAEVPGMAETLDHKQEVLLQERNDLCLVLGQWRRDAFGLLRSCFPVEMELQGDVVYLAKVRIF